MFEKYAKLRELYPDDIEKIEQEEAQYTVLLKEQEFYNLDITKSLLAECRRDVTFARMKLATDRKLDEQARAELWHIVDSRMWFIERASRNFDAELAQIESEVESQIIE